MDLSLLFLRREPRLYCTLVTSASAFLHFRLTLNIKIKKKQT